MNRNILRACAVAATAAALVTALGGCTSSTVVNESEQPTPEAAATPPAVGSPAPAETTPAPAATPGDAGKTTPEPAAGGTPAEGAKGAKGDGDACDKSDDCASGVCEGEGCGPKQGKCAAKDRKCTMDLRSYCGCDGKSFQGGGNCPKKRYAKKGACEGDPVGPQIKIKP